MRRREERSKSNDEGRWNGVEIKEEVWKGSPRVEVRQKRD